MFHSDTLSKEVAESSGVKTTFGMELECELTDEEPDMPDEWELGTDGSINTAHGGYARELRWGTGNLDTAFEALDALSEADILHESNSSMGFHVHVNIEPRKAYSAYSTEAFAKWAMDNIVGYAEDTSDTPLRNRFGNRFCRIYKRTGGDSDVIATSGGLEPLSQSEIDAQMLDSGDRYRYLNYCYRKHATMEFRIFPSTSHMNKLKDYMFLVDSTLKGWKANIKEEELAGLELKSFPIGELLTIQV